VSRAEVLLRSALESLGMSRRPAPVPERPAPLVVLSSYYLRPDDGWAIAARRYARAMALGGLDVRLSTRGRETPYDGTPEVYRETEPYRRELPRRPDLIVTSFALTGSPGPAIMEYPGAAVHVVFETADVKPAVARQLASKLVRGVWVQCAANQRALEESGCSSTLIGMPWFEDDPLLAAPPPQKVRKLLWVGREEPRKSPDRLIAAFLRAFVPGECALTMKVSRWNSNYPYPRIEQSIVEALEWSGVSRRWSLRQASDAIVVERGVYSEKEMVGLYATHDAYVSTSRGEGWNLPAYHAKLAGRRVLATDAGGERDFLGDDDVLIPQSGRVPAPAGEAGEYYADCGLDPIVAGLQELKRSAGTGVRPTFALRGDAIGRRFREWAESLTR
jgi:glycosyltransferase involved in cell wall biosynthesis